MATPSFPLSNQTLDQQIQDYLEHLEVERNLSKLTIRDYRHYLTRLSDWCQKHRIKQAQDLDNATIKKYRLSLARQETDQGKQLSKRTQAYYLIALRAFLKWLARQDLEVLSAEKIDLPKAEPHQLSFLTAEQVQRLLQMPDVHSVRGARDKAILEVLFSTGLRVSELVSLNRDQVNLETKEFGVVGKGRRLRVVFLSDQAVYWLNHYLQHRTDGWPPVFIRYAKGIDPTDDGETMRLSARSVQRIVEKYRKLAHIPVKITPHSLRHSFATDLLRNGAGLRDVQELLGHKNVATTQIYTHVTKPELKRIHQRFHSQNSGKLSRLDE
jgi:site-specific recombinase XerD